MHPLIKSGSFPRVGELFYISKLETGYIVKEIWETKLYDGDDGIALGPDAVVIDAGANVGVYSLYIQSLRAEQRPTIYAFEPIPAIFEALQANIRARGADSHVRLFNVGLSDSERSATFRFYKNAAALSSIDDRDAELHAMAERQDIMKTLREVRPAVYVLFRYLPFLRPLITRAMMKAVLEKEEVVCRLKTLSQVIADEKIERIDLLKVDVERSELPILNGIAAQDWPKIQRLVIECHEPRERPTLVALLEERGFRVQEKPDVGEYCILHASRPAPAGEA
jgi:FkbM family methyltransferase